MSIPRNWRTRQQRYLLKAEVCEGCKLVIFPPRDVCPNAHIQIDPFRNADPINSTVKQEGIEDYIKRLQDYYDELNSRSIGGKERA